MIQQSSKRIKSGGKGFSEGLGRRDSNRAANMLRQSSKIGRRW